MFILDSLWYRTIILSACIGNVKDFPSIFFLMQVKGVNSAMIEFIAKVKRIVAPGLREVSVQAELSHSISLRSKYPCEE